MISRAADPGAGGGEVRAIRRSGRTAGCLAALLLIQSAVWCAPPSFAADDAGSRKKELRRMQREAREKKQEVKRAARTERSILTELERIDRDIEAGSAEMSAEVERLRSAEAALVDVEKSGRELSGDLEGLKQRYRERIRALYKLGRSGYALEALLSDNLGDALRRAKYLGVIAQQDRQMMQHYRAALDRIAEQRRDIADRREEVLKRKKAVAAEKTALEARKRNKAALLARVKKEKHLTEQALQELEESAAGLAALIKKAEEQKAAREARRRAELRRQPEPAPASPGRFAWPVNGPVMTRFGRQHHPELGTTVFRRGIEIQARTGEAVRAAAEGDAVFADWFKGYGRLVILQHGGGLYTLYGYLSQISVKQGDRVALGQALGHAGDTGSLKGTKLYFEVRHNGEAEDPLTWLSKR